MKLYLKVLMLIAFTLGIWVVGFSPPVYATPMLRLTSGLDVVTIVDGDASDNDPAVGSVSFNGAVGSFSTNATFVLTAPAIGTMDNPQISIASLNTSNNSGGTLTIEFTDTGFLAPGHSGFLAGIGGTTEGTTSYMAYRDPGNGAFIRSELLTALGPFTPLTFDGTIGTNVATVVDPYSLTLVIEVSHLSGDHTSSFGAALSAQPEPGTMMLFGTGLLGMLGYGWHRRKQTV